MVPGKNGELIKSSDQIPPSCDVAGYKDAKCQDGERGHEAALLLDHGILSWKANNGALVSRNHTAQVAEIARLGFPGSSSTLVWKVNRGVINGASS